MCDLWHVGVVEADVAEDRSPEDTGKDEQDDGESDEHFPDIVQSTLPVLVVEDEQRLDDVIPDNAEGID